MGSSKSKGVVLKLALIPHHGPGQYLGHYVHPYYYHPHYYHHPYYHPYYHPYGYGPAVVYGGFPREEELGFRKK
jgi:hypothetical protein